MEKFFKAENYHQDYIKKNPNGYCPDHSTGVRFAANVIDQKQDNEPLKNGKNIVVIEPEGYCPYCEKFKTDVSNDYQGTIPLSSRLATNLEGLEIETPTWATPTILFLENGKEVFGYQGYLSPKEFYKALGFFKLGNSEAYRVAFDEGTDARFCKEYEIFKNTFYTFVSTFFKWLHSNYCFVRSGDNYCNNWECFAGRISIWCKFSD